MGDDRKPGRGWVPRDRQAPLGMFGKLAGGVAGAVSGERERRLAAGEPALMRDLMLTPADVASARSAA